MHVAPFDGHYFGLYHCSYQYYCSGGRVRGGSERSGEEFEDGAVVLRVFLRVPGTTLHLRR